MSTSIDNDLATFAISVSKISLRLEEFRLYDLETMASKAERAISWASSPGVRRSMVGNRSRDTAPEMEVRRYLHSVGLRYRVHARPIKDWNRRADIVFPRAKIAVFINGCFWHGCPKHYVAPKTNADYWVPKIERNIMRDLETFARLKSDGWMVIQMWEHENLERRSEKVALRIRKRLTNNGLKKSIP